MCQAWDTESLPRVTASLPGALAAGGWALGSRVQGDMGPLRWWLVRTGVSVVP